MDVCPIDIHLLVQAVLYITAVGCGLVTSIPTAFSTNNFGGNCLLYGNVEWKNKTAFSVTYGHPGACHFVVYMNVIVCIFFATGMAVYYFYAVVKSKSDKTIGSQMWVMPFIMSNALTAAITFIASCVISIGYDTLCNTFLSGKDAGAAISKCSDAQNAQWNKWWSSPGTSYTTGNFNSFLTVAQSASWIGFLVWVSQVVLCVIRFFRNRKERSKETFQGEIPTSDTAEITRQDPTA